MFDFNKVVGNLLDNVVWYFYDLAHNLIEGIFSRQQIPTIKL